MCESVVVIIAILVGICSLPLAIRDGKRNRKRAEEYYKSDEYKTAVKTPKKYAIYGDRVYVHTPNGLGNFMRKDLFDFASAHGNTAEATWYSTIPEDEVEWI